MKSEEIRASAAEAFAARMLDAMAHSSTLPAIRHHGGGAART
ncbi:hypothetical protein [Actinomadura sp. BRA 177]|nr:hypothetical protein [Actinomadura sp. BRA 177]